MKSVVSARGQMVIPKPLRERLGLRPGQVVECDEERGKLVVVKAQARTGVDAVYGVLETERTTDEMVERMRGPVDHVARPRRRGRG